MPGLDGVTLLRQVRARSPQTPVIFLTGYADARLMEEARTLGAFAVLTKPVDSERLLQTLRQALGSHHGPTHQTAR